MIIKHKKRFIRALNKMGFCNNGVFKFIDIDINNNIITYEINSGQDKKYIHKNVSFKNLILVIKAWKQYIPEKDREIFLPYLIGEE